METRIKVVISGDDSKLYYPQYKVWVFWRSFLEFTFYGSYAKCCTSIEQAQIYIDDMIEYEKKQTIKDITYVKYP